MKLNSFILRTTTVAGLGVPIFRVFPVCDLDTGADADIEASDRVTTIAFMQAT